MEKEVFSNWLEGVETTERYVQRHLSQRSYEQIPQVTDGYVVHARGFSVGNNLWLDDYSLYGDHTSLWNQHIAEEYGYSEYNDWSEYRNKVSETTLYWSITGSPAILIQWPKTQEFNSDHIQLLYDLVNSLDVPEDERVSFDSGEEMFSIGVTKL